MKSKYIFYILFAILVVITLYLYLAPYLILPGIVSGYDSKREQSDFYFRIPEMNIGITTSKIPGGKFYIMFSPKDSIAILSDSVDYIEYLIGGPDVNIIFDPRKKNEIYASHTFRKDGMNQVKYNMHVLEYEQYDSLFFDREININYPILKYPYIRLSIDTKTYSIILDRYEINPKRIKDGDIYGGW